MTPKQRAFVIEYIKDFNATRAYIAAGFSPKYANTNAAKLLHNTTILKEIENEYEKRAMSATEVIALETDIARGSADDYLHIDEYGHATIDLMKMKKAGKLHLIKKYKVTKQAVEIELYDKQAALVQMGKQHGLFPNRQELTGKDGDPLIPFTDIVSSLQKANDRDRS